MKIGIDFDRVLFDTDGFKKNLTEKFPEFNETYDQAKKDNYYNLEKHAKLLGVEEEKLLAEMRKCEEYLYSDVEKLEKLKDKHELIIVTRGDPVLQKEKLEYSGALEYFDGYEIVTDGSKDVRGIDFLVDDWKEELERIDLPGLLIDRQKEGMEKVIEYLNIPEYKKVFKRYDVRGKYPEEVNEYFAYRLGRSVAKLVRKRTWEKQVVVCKDPKETSDNLKKSLIRGIKNGGVYVVDSGTGSTDYLAFSSVEENSVGIQVTSSHMKLEFNGFKLVYPEGNGFMNKDLDCLKQIFRENSFQREEDGAEIEKTYYSKYLDAAEDFTLKHFQDTERKIVLDNLGGIKSSRAGELLETLGAEVINLSGDKPKIDPPDPKPENLRHIERKVEETGSDMGIATDMDADRIAIYYQDEWLSGDEIFAVLIEVMKPEKVVASIDSTEIIEETAEKHGEIEYTQVGDPFVIDRTIGTGAKLSGEPNGHYCFTQFVPYNSGTLAAAMIAGSNLNEIKKKLPDISIMKKSIEVDDKYSSMEKVKKEVKKRFKIISEIDGIKFQTDNSRVLIRSSGSSHKLRITAESNTEKGAENVLKKSEKLIQNT
ncbi:MAG: hypothetical protein BRC29_03255 [Nanohaloarchaea archaeon SW_7_43_1]|nr:MAG: hypothetical protein BRC29_03255 [Nanohaloarchaea archaeon SW_7_43_1]